MADAMIEAGHFYGEKVCGGKYVPVHLEKLRPAHPSLTSLGCWINMMTPKNIAHGNLVNAMSQVGQGTLDAAVPPGRVVVGHLQDERFDLIRDAGSP